VRKELLIIFVKAPRPGAVKTRLARAIGAVEACRAYSLLTERVLLNLQELETVQIRFSPDEAAKEIKHWIKPGWQHQPQHSGDLGQRLQLAFEESFRAGYSKVAIIGSDCPDVTSHDVQTAWSALDNCDVVLGPAADGGYWLIALKQALPILFEGIAWSTDSVLVETVHRAKGNGLKVELLRQLRDIDSESDWLAVRDRLIA
jgi:rSAM/selenodomain-associated transferase 1